MTEADRESYRRQFEAAKRRLPRGHVINHVQWQDGHLRVMSAPVQRQPAAPPDEGPKVRRGVQAGLFD